MQAFDYDNAFSRNIGWVTKDEQQTLRDKRVAVAGLGGVGGVHVLTLARLGVEHFTLADFDIFEEQNFNRQAGAMVSTIGKSKLDVISAMARDINPNIQITRFPEGVTPENVDTFLKGADVYIDSLDYFVFDIRSAVMAACARNRVPAITAGPIGIGAAVVSFLPGKMTFEEYFRWHGATPEEKAIKFMIGLAPKGLHRSYLVDPSAVDFANNRGPSTIMACQMCAGIAASEALKIMLGRGKVYCAPYSLQWDAYHSRLAKSWRPGGNNNVLQKLIFNLAKKKFAKKNR